MTKKQLFILNFLLSATFFLLASFFPVYAERGRVQVRDGTIWSDCGTMLRGGTMKVLDPSNSYTQHCVIWDNWVHIRDLKLNIVRFGVGLGDYGMTVEEQLSKMDQMVDWAAELGLYIAININNSPPGQYNAQELKDFWKIVAPRYKDRTHVIYEPINEPVGEETGWYPQNYTNQNIADFKEAYEIIRAAAPDTHISLWDFANMPDGPLAVQTIQKMTGIDYSNASVSWHWYGANDSASNDEVLYVKDRYPLWMSETMYFQGDPPLRIARLEDMQISWTHLDGRTPSSTAVLEADLQELERMGYTWDADWEVCDLSSPTPPPTVSPSPSPSPSPGVSPSPGTNLALGKTVTTSNEGYLPASNLVDGVWNTLGDHWAGVGSPQWVRVDLGQDYPIERIKVGPYGPGSDGTYYYNGSWNIQYSTSSNPNNYQNFTGVSKLSGAGSLVSPGISITNGNPGHSNPDSNYQSYEFSFTPTTARYIRYTVTQGDNDTDSNGDELEVYTTSGETPQCQADLNHDNSVNLADIVILLSKWGQTGDLPEDLNNNGRVDLADIQFILTYWGQGC